MNEPCTAEGFECVSGGHAETAGQIPGRNGVDQKGPQENARPNAVTEEKQRSQGDAGGGPNGGSAGVDEGEAKTQFRDHEVGQR